MNASNEAAVKERLEIKREGEGRMPPGPISGPSAWYGPELAKRDDWMLKLSSAEHAEIDNAVEAFKRSGRPLSEIKPELFPLPKFSERLKGALHQMIEGRGFILLRGLDVERYSREQNAIAYMGLGSHFGVPRSQNAKGHLLGHVADLGLKVEDPNVRYYQTSRRLDYHTDSVDIVGLLCLKTAMSGGESFIVSSTTCYNEILKRRPDLLPRLFDAFPTDRRGEVPEGMLPWFEIPVFHWLDGKLTAILSMEYIESAQARFPQAPRLTDAHREALELLRSLVNDPALNLSMEFRPGDMQFLHNHQILHARNDFVNWPEPERRRHLLRLWLCPSNGRNLPQSFAARYGSTEQGNRGGIVVRGTQFTVPLQPE